MRQLSQIIEVHFVRKVNDGTARIYDARLMANESVNIDEQPNISNAGATYDQSLQITVDAQGNDYLRNLSNPEVVTVTLHDGERAYQWGTQELPVRLYAMPFLDKFTLNFKCVSTRSIFH